MKRQTSRMFMAAAVLTIGLAVPGVAMIGGTWVTYNTSNSGVASDDVRTICIDNSGYLWFGTSNGLSYFDGVIWKTYTTADKLAHNVVHDIAHEITTHGEEIWVATEGGVSVVGIGADAVTFATPYTTTNANYPGMISDKVFAAAVDSQHVRWFGTDQGLMSFDGTLWKAYTTEDNLADNHVNAIAYEETKYGPEVWLGTNNGISVVSTKVDAVSFATPYRTNNENYPGMISDMIYSATVDTVNNLRWFGTDKGAIAFGAREFTSYTMNDFLSNERVNCVTVDRNGMVFFGTQGGGVSRYDGVSGASPIDTAWSGIASDNINDILITRNGAIWFATDNGVTRWIPEGLTVAEETSLPVAVDVKSVYPNPFNPSTTIEISLEKAGQASLSIYNLAGQKVCDLASGVMNAGNHSFVWNGRDRNGNQVSSGVYFANLRMGDTVVNRKMTLMK